MNTCSYSTAQLKLDSCTCLLVKLLEKFHMKLASCMQVHAWSNEIWFSRWVIYSWHATSIASNRHTYHVTCCIACKREYVCSLYYHTFALLNSTHAQYMKYKHPNCSICLVIMDNVRTYVFNIDTAASNKCQSWHLFKWL